MVHMKAEMRGALTEDLKLDVVILEPWSLALTQEHSLIMGSDVTQGQRGHRVLEAKAVLIFTRFTLALALVHTENQYLPLLVNLRERSREMRATYQRDSCFPHNYCPPKSRRSPKTSPLD